MTGVERSVQRSRLITQIVESDGSKTVSFRGDELALGHSSNGGPLKFLPSAAKSDVSMKLRYHEARGKISSAFAESAVKGIVAGLRAGSHPGIDDAAFEKMVIDASNAVRKEIKEKAEGMLVGLTNDKPEIKAGQVAFVDRVLDLEGYVSEKLAQLKPAAGGSAFSENIIEDDQDGPPDDLPPPPDAPFPNPSFLEAQMFAQMDGVPKPAAPPLPGPTSPEAELVANDPKLNIPSPPNDVLPPPDAPPPPPNRLSDVMNRLKGTPRLHEDAAAALRNFESGPAGSLPKEALRIFDDRAQQGGPSRRHDRKAPRRR
jgi:hypothetical protein